MKGNRKVLNVEVQLGVILLVLYQCAIQDLDEFQMLVPEEDVLMIFFAFESVEQDSINFDSFEFGMLEDILLTLFFHVEFWQLREDHHR